MFACELASNRGTEGEHKERVSRVVVMYDYVRAEESFEQSMN